MSSAAMPAMVAKRFGYALKRAQNALRLAMDDALQSLDLTAPQYAVLSALEAEPGLSSARLARAAFVTPQTMQGVLANLQRDGLVERHPDPTHGRVLSARLTKRGRKMVSQAHILVRVVEETMMASLGSIDADEFAGVLNKCADDLSKNP